MSYIKSLTSSRAGLVSVIFGLAALYYAAARPGFMLAIPPGNVTAVWFPSGIALAAILIFGYRVWPGVWIGSFLLNSSFLADAGASLASAAAGSLIKPIIVGSAIATGSTLEILLAGYLLYRSTGSRMPCDQARSVIMFAVFSGALSCTVGSTVGAASLLLGGYVSPDGFAATWLTWWIGDISGILVLTPFVMTWWENPRLRLSPRKAVDVLTVFSLVAVSGLLLFGGWVPDGGVRVAMAYLAVPILLFPAIRFAQREAATANVLFLGIGFWGFLRGYDPFHEGSSPPAILLLQGFVGILAVATLTLSAHIAHRRRVDARLRRYEMLSLQTADHWMLTDRYGTVLEVNPSFERISGYSAEEVVGRKSNVLKSGLHDASYYKNMWHTILSGRVYRGVVVNRKKNGELFYEMKTITPLKDDAGKITHFLSLGKDITELKVTETKLRETAESLDHANKRLSASEAELSRQNRILESVLNSMDEGVIVANVDGELVTFNQAAERIVGIGLTDARTNDWTARYGVYLPGTDIPFPAEQLPLACAIKGEKTDEMEMFIRNPDKLEGAWISGSGRPLKGEGGEIIGGVVVIRDITPQKRAEEFEKELKSTKEELELAGRIQKQLFPNKPPRIYGFDIAGASYPAVATGGVYFDYIEMPDGHLVAVVGDVSGHGVGPALIMASTRAYLHALLRSDAHTGDVLELINRLLASETAPEDFVTLILTRIDPATRVLEYASAGHPACYVLDSRNQIKSSLQSTGPPLGILPDATFEAKVVTLDPGDLVVLLTDGILEAECPDGEPFGVERTLDVVRDNRGKNASGILMAIRDELSRLCPGGQQDDLTAVIIGVQPRNARTPQPASRSVGGAEA